MEKEVKSTPGPWYSKKASVYTTDRDGTFNKRVAECFSYEDAELIAQLPDLLAKVEALRLLLLRAEMYVLPTEQTNELLKDIRKALES